MTIRRIASAAVFVTLVAAGCGSTQTTQTVQDSTPPAAAPAASSAPAATGALSIIDPWVKTASSGMTAAFGTLVNNTDSEITVVSGTSPVSPMIELHEVYDAGSGEMKMRPKEGGFVIPAHGTHELKPGGDHIMLMGVKDPITPGSEVSFTLTAKDGTTLTFTAVGKEFAGAQESYEPGPGSSHGADHGSGSHG